MSTAAKYVTEYLVYENAPAYEGGITIVATFSSKREADAAVNELTSFQEARYAKARQAYDAWTRCTDDPGEKLWKRYQRANLPRWPYGHRGSVIQCEGFASMPVRCYLERKP